MERLNLIAILLTLLATQHSVAVTVDEWLVKSAFERQQIRATMTQNEAIVIWNAMTLSQQNALIETNRSLLAIQSGQDVAPPTGARYTINQWMVKSPSERKDIRNNMSQSESLALWNALNISQQNSLNETNQALNRLNSAPPNPPGLPIEIVQEFKDGDSRFVFTAYTDRIVSIPFRVPYGPFLNPAGSVLYMSCAEFQGQPWLRRMTVSKTPGDMNAAIFSQGKEAFIAGNVGVEFNPGDLLYVNILIVEEAIPGTTRSGFSVQFPH